MEQATEMYIAFRKGIKELIDKNPNATAKDVLQGLELTLDMIKLFEKRIGENEVPKV